MSNNAYPAIIEPDVVSAREVYGRLSISDIVEVACPCFQMGQFDKGGNILGHRIGVYSKGHPRDCSEEYWCEMFAACLLMPLKLLAKDLEVLRQTYPKYGFGHTDPILQIADKYQVEPWAVRFRICLLSSDQGYFSPYRWSARFSF